MHGSARRRNVAQQAIKAAHAGAEPNERRNHGTTTSSADVCGHDRESTDPKWQVCARDTQEGGQRMAIIDYDELSGI